jgi:LmbE family N-acetylglucosaminyl deacetylase
MPATKLLLFAAHCDDGELWSGGTIARLTELRKRVVLAISHHDAIRRREARQGAAILGCEVWFRQNSDDTLQWATRCLHEAQPEVLVTHPIADPHFEHSDLSSAVIKALTKSKQRKLYPVRWYWFDTYYSAQSPGFPILINITRYFDRKCRALGCHRSQKPQELLDMARVMNRLHGQRSRVQYAEAFHPFSLLGRVPLLRNLP